jgi:hypothetical protein
LAIIERVVGVGGVMTQYVIIAVVAIVLFLSITGDGTARTEK